MSKTKTLLNRHLVARRLQESIHTGQLPGPVASAATALIGKIDANEGGIGAATSKLISESWMTVARDVASGAAKVPALKAIAELEEKLGLAPEAAAEEVAEAPAKTDDDTVADASNVAAESIAPAPVWSAR